MAKPKRQFGQVPMVLIRGADNPCLRLYAYLAAKTGPPNGRPVHGYKAIGDQIGLQARIVREHAQHLADLGLVKVVVPGGQSAHKAAELSVVGDPTEIDHPGGTDLAPREPRKRAKSGTYSGDLSKSDGEDVVRPVHPWGASRARLRGASRAPTRSASDAPRSRYAGEGLERSGSASSVDRTEQENGTERWFGRCDVCRSDNVAVQYDPDTRGQSCDPCRERPL